MEGWIYALDTVDVVVELTLDNRLEIGLHVLSSYLHHVSDGVLASKLHLVHIRSDDGDLVVFDLGSLFGLNQLAAVYTGTVEFHLHIAAADDLAFKCGCRSY